jgi:hypothetical protein
MRFLCLIIATSALVACGASNDTGSTEGGSGGLDCQTDATAKPDAANKTITASATVTCAAKADINVKLCIQSDAGGAWKDLMCQSVSASDKATADVKLVASCGAVTSGRSYRANATTTAQAGTSGSDDFATSAEVSCE